MSKLTGHEWKDLAKCVQPKILHELYKVICRQTNCCGLGVNETSCGVCAFCADATENVVGEYLRLTAVTSTDGAD